jgi:lauroyl/myristoyl acyltransferase
MKDYGEKIRDRIYHMSLAFGLFYYLPVVVRLPAPLSKSLLKLKSWMRFTMGTYRGYVNRPGLKKKTIENLVETLGIDSGGARNMYRKLMQLEVLVERNTHLLNDYRLSDLENHFVIHGLDILEEELKKGKGVIFATVHSGDSLLFMYFLALKGFRIYGLFDRDVSDMESRDPLIKFAKLKDKKLSGTVGKIYAGKGLSRLYGVLEENGIVVWMVDLPVKGSKRREKVRFLDSQIFANNSLTEVAAKTGSSLVPHITVYDFETDKHTVYIGNSVDIGKNSLQNLFDFYEPHVRRTPESWIIWYIFDMLKVYAEEGVAGD